MVFSQYFVIVNGLNCCAYLSEDAISFFRNLRFVLTSNSGWIGAIIAYFDERSTSGVVEGINNKLKLIKRRAYGMRNFTNFKLRT